MTALTYDGALCGRIESILDQYGDVLGVNGIDCRRIDDLRTEVAELHRIGEAELVNDIGCPDHARVCGHEAVHVSPYLETVGVQGSCDDAGGVVGAAASEIGDLAGTGVCGYETGDDGDLVASLDAGEFLADEILGDFRVEDVLALDHGGLDELKRIVEERSRKERAHDHRGHPLAETHDLARGLGGQHAERVDALVQRAQALVLDFDSPEEPVFGLGRLEHGLNETYMAFADVLV